MSDDVDQKRTPEGHRMWEHKVLLPQRPTDMVADIMRAGLEGFQFVQCIPNIGYVVMVRPILEDADILELKKRTEVVELEALEYHERYDRSGSHPAGLHRKGK